MMIRSGRKCSNLFMNHLNNIRKINKSIVFAEKFTELVPALGESITEGSIAKWTKNVGEKINIDDVIVIVETDKVTVDIKSSRSGVLLKQLASDIVIVGNPLYEIDTDSTIIPTTSASLPITPPKATENISASSKEDHSHSGRIPMIKFIGKRSLLPKDIASSKVPQLISPPKIPSIKATKPSTGVDFTTLKDKGFYGRPKISLKETEAIESGGATAVL